MLNDQISQRARSAEMVKIAVGILREEPEIEKSDSGGDQLRLWAINVLRDPEAEHTLSEKAAAILRERSIGGIWSGGIGGFGGGDGLGGSSGSGGGPANIVWVPMSGVDFTDLPPI